MSGLRRYQGDSGISGLGRGSARVGSGPSWGGPGGCAPRRGFYWLIKTLLALIGLMTVVGGGSLYWRIDQLDPRLSALAKETVALRAAWGDFDPDAARVYVSLGRDILRSGNFAEAILLRMAVAEGRSEGDVEQAVKAAARRLNPAGDDGGEMALQGEAEVKGGDPYGVARQYLACDARTVAALLDHSHAYLPLQPCRLTLSRDPQGGLWLSAFDLELLISGGKPLSPELKAEALKAKETLLEIMRRGAVGDS